MRVRGYGVRPSNNGYSGQERSGDEFNRSYKAVRYTRAEEYATRDVKEYHHYPEQKDLTQDDDDKKQNDSKKDNSKNSGRSHIAAIQQVVVALVGAAVVATSYSTAMAKRAAKQVQDPNAAVVETTDRADQNDQKDQKDQKDKDKTPAYTASWEWSSDNKEAFLILTDASGKQIAKVSATVTTEDEASSCNTAGKRIFNASAEYKGKSYTDSRDEEIPPLGHKFGEKKEITLDNGETAVEVECERCGEHFVIQNSLTEE